MMELSEKAIERAMEIGGIFFAWTPETGPCPISITNDVWFKRLCGLFETQATLEAEVKARRERCEELELRLDVYYGNMYDVVVAENERLRGLLDGIWCGDCDRPLLDHAKRCTGES
jgi:hypothetical protein